MDKVCAVIDLFGFFHYSLSTNIFETLTAVMNLGTALDLCQVFQS